MDQPLSKRQKAGVVTNGEDASHLLQIESQRRALTISLVGSLPRDTVENLLIDAGLNYSSVMARILAANSPKRNQFEIEPQKTTSYGARVWEGQGQVAEGFNNKGDTSGAKTLQLANEFQQELHSSGDMVPAKAKKNVGRPRKSIQLPRGTKHVNGIKSTFEEGHLNSDDELDDSKLSNTGDVYNLGKKHTHLIPKGKLPPETGNLVEVGVLAGHTNIVNAGFTSRMHFHWRITKFSRDGEPGTFILFRTCSIKKDKVELHPSLDMLDEEGFYREVLRRQYARQDAQQATQQDQP